MCLLPTAGPSTKVGSTSDRWGLQRDIDPHSEVGPICVVILFTEKNRFRKIIFHRKESISQGLYQIQLEPMRVFNI